MNEETEVITSIDRQTELHQDLSVWLKEHKAVLITKVRTPADELIKPENFTPVGWPVIVIVMPQEA